MKRRAQEHLLTEYERRQSEFSSFEAFVQFTAERSRLWQRLARPEATATRTKASDVDEEDL
jgi:hypothetical protein